MIPLSRAAKPEVDWRQVHARLAQATAAAREAMQPSPERAALLLEKRARRLAQPLAAARSTGVMLELLTFVLTGERYGIETSHVHEVVRFSGLTPIPGAPDVVAGVANLRGEILVVFDLRPLFGRAADATGTSRIVICGASGPEFGIVVDAVNDVMCRPADEVMTDAMAESNRAGNLIRGLTKSAMVVIDGSALLADPRLFVDQRRQLPYSGE